jgi:Sulfotransferase domain
MVTQAYAVLPAPLVRAGRSAHSRATTMTAGLRLAPSFILVGAQRCGTTSLYRALADHPQAAPPPFHKGINYFDLHYYCGIRWYLGHFPVAWNARRGAARYGEAAAFEASGYYLYHPCALERLAHDLPTVKIVVMLRDPVERAFSAYKHECARGFEREDFERALALEDDRLAGEIDRIKADPAYDSFSHRHHSYRHRGHYAEQLERAFELFPRSQVYVLDSESFFERPALEYEQLLAFLGLRPFLPAFGAHNSRPGAPMPASARRLLEDYYAPHDERLAKLLDRPFRWLR